MDVVRAGPVWRPRRAPPGRPGSGRTGSGRTPGVRTGAGHLERVPAGDPARSPDSSLRIAMLAPPWISVPAPGYGGVESVVSTLTEALVRRGHDVTLFCAPGSVSRASVVTLLEA